MKNDSTTELDGNSRLFLRDMAAGGDSTRDVETTMADLWVVLVNRGLTADDIEEIRLKLTAGRKAVIGGGEHPVQTVFWPVAGIPTGGEPLAVEKLEAEKLARAAAPELLAALENAVAIHHGRRALTGEIPAEQLPGWVRVALMAIARAKGGAL